MSEMEQPGPRSAGARRSRRPRLPWPADREFRILSIDGGGIRGIFPAAVLADLEERFLGGASVAGCFDLITGTSTGGIVALGLGAGLTAAELRDLNVDRGCEIFPPTGKGFIGRLRGGWKAARQYGRYIYDQNALAAVLREKLGERKFGSSIRRLCVPSFEGDHGEVYIFKTPHHPDFKTDWRETMVKVALATSAAPTYYRPFRDAGYIFVDGGVWANNPIMIALVEALASFEVTREQIRILSIGCGETAFTVQASQLARGGLVQWRNIISAAMRLQSQNALGQAGLLIGPERMIRIDLPRDFPAIQLDDWSTAVERLPGEATRMLAVEPARLGEAFLYGPAAPYIPAVEMEGS
jgi:patatin-like phospholipase/acyl hydrolase